MGPRACDLLTGRLEAADCTSRGELFPLWATTTLEAACRHPSGGQLATRQVWGRHRPKGPRVTTGADQPTALAKGDKLIRKFVLSCSRGVVSGTPPVRILLARATNECVLALKPSVVCSLWPLGLEPEPRRRRPQTEADTPPATQIK